MTCALMDRIGTFPKSLVLGAMCQIQSRFQRDSPRSTRASPLQARAFQAYTTERLTRPYSGGPVRLRRIPSQQATIAGLPHNSNIPLKGVFN
jgi:hypothetical protein